MDFTNDDIVKMVDGDARVQNKVFNNYFDIFKIKYGEELAIKILNTAMMTFKLPEGDGNEYGGQFTSFIYLIAKNAYIDTLRINPLSKKVSFTDIKIRTSDGEFEYDVEDIIVEDEFEEERILLKHAIDLLPLKDKELVKLHFKGLSAKEIALQLGMNVNTVKVQIKRSKDLIKKYFSDGEKRKLKKIRGVYEDKNGNFTAKIASKEGGKQHYIGSFATRRQAEEAILNYKK